MENMLTVVKPEIVADSSRIMQESCFAEQGDPSYANLTGFLGITLNDIDKVSDYLANWVGSEVINKVQDSYYHDSEHKVKSFLKRNVYTNENERRIMQKRGEVLGNAAEVGVSAVLKYTARGILSFKQKNEKFKVFQQLYSILALFIKEAESGADVNRGLAELNKIRNSFPLSASEKKKIKDSININDDINSINVSAILDKDNTELRNALAYFLTVLQRQLYQDKIPAHSLLPEYYSLIDINGVNAKNIIAENTENYDVISSSQLAYLEISRGIVKQTAISAPSIDLDEVMKRNKIAAQYDPYAIRRMKVKKSVINGSKTISGILAAVYTQNPALIKCSVSTALAQFSENDMIIESIQNQCVSWGMERKDVDTAIEGKKVIDTECNNNDANVEC